MKLEVLDNEVVFHSPVIHTPKNGQKITEIYLTASFHVLFIDTF